ncbi:hypothetical protein LCGC14_2294440, partial [marine sediment metagenome]
VAALAAAIAGEEVPVIIEGKDSVSDLDKPASDGKPPAKGDGEAASEGTPKPGAEGDGKPGEGEEGGEQEDPLKDLATNKDALRVLLEHPDLGPLLNRWNDRSAVAQVTAALERETPTIEANAKQSEAERAEDAHFSEMTQEQIAEEIAGDKGAATAYARYQQRQEAGTLPNAEAVAQASEVYSHVTRVASIRGLLEGSELTDEVKETLKPGNFTHLKAEGIRVWEKAVLQAIVDHESTGKAQTLLEEKWEGFKEERLAELDGDQPALISGGRSKGAMPNLMETDSTVQLEQGLAAEEAKRNK